ncbi:ankyrin repeat domain-containing protein [Armatimonas sp.]|uniref:ankyrin repeat domain-containing protein n=1 Tax=Armatimonas sp. TaxID=1872638 RepID=UPI00286A462B|nr:ankyrin repeat domain-containing protein [Armatimonas sp.]
MKRRWVKPLAWLFSGIVLLVTAGLWRFVVGPKLLYKAIGQQKLLIVGEATVMVGQGVGGGRKEPGESAATVQLLLRLGVSPNQLDAYDEQTPLHKAVMAEDLATCRVLLDAGVSPNIRSWFGSTPLHLMMHHQGEEVLELLLAHGADPNLKDSQGATPLHAPFQDVEQFQGWEDKPLLPKYALLIKAGGRLDLRDKDGRTPLYLATEYGLPEVYDLMVASGADRKEKTPDGATLLQAAASGRFVFDDEGKITLLKKLAPLFGTINTPDNEGYTPLDYAVPEGKYKDGMGVQDFTIVELKRLGAKLGKATK